MNYVCIVENVIFQPDQRRPYEAGESNGSDRPPPEKCIHVCIHTPEYNNINYFVHFYMLYLCKFQQNNNR